MPLTPYTPGIMSYIGDFTWANLLAVASPQDGWTADVTDLGNQGWVRFIYSAERARWVPINGQYLHYQTIFSSIASPVVTITGSIAAQFAIPGGNPALPPNLLSVGSRVRCEAIVRKRNANAVATVNVRIGTAGTTADSLLSGPQVNIANGSVIRTFSDAWFFSSAAFLATNNVIPMASNTTPQMADRASNIDLASAMQVSIDIAGANVADALDLLGLIVTVSP